MGKVFMLLYCDRYTIRETVEKIGINERTVKNKSKQSIHYLKKQ